MKELKFIEEFQDEARAETLRQVIVEALQIKFGAAAAKEFASALAAITDNDRLARLHRLLLRCADLDQFRRRFPKA